MEGMIWALIIVTGTANVNISTGYPSKTLCEDAISIAKTGMTVMENKSAEEAEKIREARLDQEFAASHPSRPATADDNAKCSHGTKSSISFGSGNDPTCMVDDDTKTVSFTRHSYFTMGYGSIYDPVREIKYAKCVLVDPKDR
jgi:hypothetical protein